MLRLRSLFGLWLFFLWLVLAFGAYALDCSAMAAPEVEMQCCRSMSCPSHGDSHECCQSMPNLHAPFVKPGVLHSFSLTVVTPLHLTRMTVLTLFGRSEPVVATVSWDSPP